MAAPINAVISAAGTYVFPMDYRQAPFNAAIEVNVGVATVSYHVDFTLTDTNYPPTANAVQNWDTLAAFPVASTTTLTSALQSPVAMLRLVVASLVGPPIYFNVLQGDFVGT
jgi:hypothetical protein